MSLRTGISAEASDGASSGTCEGSSPRGGSLRARRPRMRPGWPGRGEAGRMHAAATVVITGASSGIGRATARLFAQDGARLVLAGRDADTLEAVAAECRDRGA